MMARPRLNPDALALTGAERQRRYREARRAAGHVEMWVANSPAADAGEQISLARTKNKSRQISRPQRWALAVAKAQDAITTLRELHDEYQNWNDSLPDNLRSSALAEKLEAVAGLDIDGLEGTLSEFESADLPRGFGRD